MEWSDYLAAAQARLALPSPSALALRLGQHAALFSQYRKGMLPSESMLVAVAEAAGVDAERAIADLARWRAERSGIPAAIDAARRLAARVAVAVLAVILGAPIGNATSPRTPYLDIMRSARRLAF